MSQRTVAPIRVWVAALGLLSLAAAPIAARTPSKHIGVVQAFGQGAQSASQAAKTNKSRASAPKTPWGDPDLEGLWSNATRTPFERPADLAGRQVLTDKEVADLKKQAQSRVDRAPRPGDTGTYNRFWWEDGDFSNRTSLVVDPADGRLPSLTPEGQKAAAWQRGTDWWEDRTLWERCITRGLPNTMIPGFYINNYHIVQTPGYVIIVAEMIHDARIIPLDGRPHIGKNLRQWMGDSRGRWEGNTLVVDTTNFNDKTAGRLNPAGSYQGSGDALHLVERFTRLDAETIDYAFTVNDPKQFTRPWTANIPMKKDDGNQVFEYACHEGNIGLEDILTGARDEEKAAEGSANPK